MNLLSALLVFPCEVSQPFHLLDHPNVGECILCIDFKHETNDSLSHSIGGMNDNRSEAEQKSDVLGEYMYE